MGGKHRRVRGDAYWELMDEFLTAVRRRYGTSGGRAPGAVVGTPRWQACSCRQAHGRTAGGGAPSAGRMCLCSIPLPLLADV